MSAPDSVNLREWKKAIWDDGVLFVWNPVLKLFNNRKMRVKSHFAKEVRTQYEQKAQIQEKQYQINLESREQEIESLKQELERYRKQGIPELKRQIQDQATKIKALEEQNYQLNFRDQQTEEYWCKECYKKIGLNYA